MRDPGPLLASGRDADIFDYGPGLVLRRSRNGRSMTTEARIMDYVRAHGYPVPAVEELSEDGTQLVMERIVGRSMVDEATRRPWTIATMGADLARLHARLHLLDAPDWLEAAPGSPGRQLLHLDLHPLNVMVGPRGPVVIDWPNARAGSAAVDAAVTWLLSATADVPGNPLAAALLGRFRSRYLRAFLAGCDRGAAARELAAVAAWKAQDPNMSRREISAMDALARQAGK